MKDPPARYRCRTPDPSVGMVFCVQAASFSCSSSGITPECPSGCNTPTKASEAFAYSSEAAAFQRVRSSSLPMLAQAGLDVAARYDYVEVLQLMCFLLEDLEHGWKQLRCKAGCGD